MVRVVYIDVFSSLYDAFNFLAFHHNHVVMIICFPFSYDYYNLYQIIPSSYESTKPNNILSIQSNYMKDIIQDTTKEHSSNT